jgi:peptidoglycan/LPS O-acetylase OafA/YrhL
MQKKKLPFEILDSIRGIAALYVVIAHCRGCLWIGGNQFMKMFPRETWDFGDYMMFGASMLTRLAVEFVIVFFVLSGFSIAHSLSSNKSALPFYKRRFIRIYPSYVVALIWAGLVFVLTRYWFPQWYDGSLTDFSYIRAYEMNSYLDKSVILHNLLYMPGQGFVTPFWSLTYEVIFYLLAPFLLRKANWYAIISFLLFAVNFLAPQLTAKIQMPAYISSFLFVYNIYFVIGVTLYANYDWINNLFAKLNRKLVLVGMAGLVLSMYAVNFYFKIETVYSFMIAAVLGTMLILYFLQYQVRIKWLMAVGKYSYTLYITHFASVFLYLALYWLIAKPSVPYILNYFIWMPAVFFALGIAYIQYLLVERNTKNILGRLRANQKRKTPDPSLQPVPVVEENR